MAAFFTRLQISLVQWLILHTQRTRFAGAGDYTALGSQSGASADAFPQAREEARRFEDFFQFFETPVRTMIQGRRLLDLGSGYGGRTLEFVRQCRVHSAIGVEVYERLVTLSTQYVRGQSLTNCNFLLGSQDTVPLEDESVDVVVSYDVVEHVADPRKMLTEIRRVLAPGGMAFIVFTPYWGAISHHLTYITKLPSLHWVFSPDVLVMAINGILQSPLGRSFGTNAQPLPKQSYDGRKRVLPSLNGAGSLDVVDMCRDFEVVETRWFPLLTRFPVLGRAGSALNAALIRVVPVTRDLVCANFALVLRKQR